MKTLLAAALMLAAAAASAETVTCGPNTTVGRQNQATAPITVNVPDVAPLSQCTVPGQTVLDDFSRSFVTGGLQADRQYCLCWITDPATAAKCIAARNFLRYLQSGPKPVRLACVASDIGLDPNSEAPLVRQAAQSGAMRSMSLYKAQ